MHRTNSLSNVTLCNGTHDIRARNVIYWTDPDVSLMRPLRISEMPAIHSEKLQKIELNLCNF